MRRTRLTALLLGTPGTIVPTGPDVSPNSDKAAHTLRTLVASGHLNTSWVPGCGISHRGTQLASRSARGMGTMRAGVADGADVTSGAGSGVALDDLRDDPLPVHRSTTGRERTLG
jgi:hypothetical protein